MTTLIDVQKNFSKWRETRQSRKEKIPAILWQQVASIYSSYSRSLICQTLGLSGSQLKAAMQGDGFATFYLDVKNAHDSIIKNNSELPISTCEISLEKQDVRLIVKVPNHEFSKALAELVRYMPC